MVCVCFLVVLHSMCFLEAALDLRAKIFFVYCCFCEGAAMAVDDNMDTFWASRFDETNDPVEFVIDLGEVQRLSSMEIAWEFPAQAFGVALSQDGEHYDEAFETDANVLKTSQVSLGMKAARKVRITMGEVSVMFRALLVKR